MPYKKSNKSIQDSAFKLRSGNTTPFKQMGSKEYKFPVSRLLEKGKRAYKTIKHRLRKSELLHPKTYSEHSRDMADSRMYAHYLKEINEGKETKESSPGYQSYHRKLYKPSGDRKRRPNQYKHWIEGNE